MPLSDIASISIGLNTTAISQPGFGVPLILSFTAGWTERTRTYTTLTGVAGDFATTTAEYKAASALFSQSPAPAKIMIGRCALKPTQKWRIIPTAVNSTVYKVVVDGQTASYTSDSSATVAEITAGLKVAIDALSLAVATTDNTTSLDVLANVAGAWHSLAPAGEPTLGAYLAISQTHADPGAATDLANIAIENSDWYAIVNSHNSSAHLAAIAAWAEANGKLFVAATQDTLCATQANGVGTDIAQTLHTAADVRSALLFHPDNSQFADAAWAGAKLPYDPGSETWKFATLAGVSAVSLTATQQTNLEAKNCNYYYAVGGKNITSQGITPGGQFIDVIRGRDWFAARLQTRFMTLLTKSSKTPYTDRGIGAIEAEVRSQCEEGIAQGFVSPDIAYSVIVPKSSAVSSGDRASRTLNNVTFSATIQGAIHKLAVTGVLSA
jgi:hypothetical protein